MLDIRLLGAPQVHLNGDLLTDLVQSPNLVRLFAFLVLQRDQPQPRAKLADLFYPDCDEGTARRNLNQLLYRLRRALQNYPCLLATGQTVQFDARMAYWLDVAEFELKIGAEDVATISAAIALYRGELLEGIYDDWCIPVRERLHERYLLGLSALVGMYEASGKFEQALELARRWVQADPLSDEAHYHAIELALLMNRLDEARARFDQYKTMRRNELNLAPSARILQLVYRYDLQPHDDQPADRQVEAICAALASLIRPREEEPAQAAEIRQRMRMEIINDAEALGDLFKARFASDEALTCYRVALDLLSGAAGVQDIERRRQRELTLRCKCDEIYDLTANRGQQLQNVAAIEQLARSLDEPKAMLDALLRRSWAEARNDNYAASVIAAERALEVAKQCRSMDIAIANRILGLACFDDGDFLRAKQCFSAAMELDEALGHNDAFIADKLNMAATGIALGAYEAALTELENIQDGQALPPLLRARWLGLRGQVLTRLGRPVQADAPLKSAFALSRQIGDRDLEWWLAGRMANLYWARGEIERAVILAREYYKSAVASSRAQSCVDLSESLAKFYIHSGRGSEALDWANCCAQTANARNLWRYRMRAQLRLAQAYRLLNDPANAQAHAQEALRLYRQRNQTLEEHDELMGVYRECVSHTFLPQ